MEKKKVELNLHESIRLKLLKDTCYTANSSYGPYHLYSVADQDGNEMSFFAPEDIHQQIVRNGLKAGSEFILHKKASQNGKKITGELVFEPVKDTPALEPTNGKDLYKEIMAQCLQDAITIVRSIDGVPLQAEDVRAISSCLFIARTRIN